MNKEVNYNKVQIAVERLRSTEASTQFQKIKDFKGTAIKEMAKQYTQINLDYKQGFTCAVLGALELCDGCYKAECENCQHCSVGIEYNEIKKYISRHESTLKYQMIQRRKLYSVARPCRKYR